VAQFNWPEAIGQLFSDQPTMEVRGDAWDGEGHQPQWLPGKLVGRRPRTSRRSTQRDGRSDSVVKSDIMVARLDRQLAGAR
jgi:hypothetical protein